MVTIGPCDKQLELKVRVITQGGTKTGEDRNKDYAYKGIEGKIYRKEKKLPKFIVSQQKQVMHDTR